MPWNPERYNVMKPKIIHTKTFSCDDDHPIVWYTFDENNKAMCDYCATQFVYEPKDFYDKAKEEKELLDMSMKESVKQKKERTHSEKMQDDLEPIPISCPMDEYYDEPESSADRDDYVNKILKGSG
mgnify:CR=1 FL=1